MAVLIVYYYAYVFADNYLSMFHKIGFDFSVLPTSKDCPMTYR